MTKTSVPHHLWNHKAAQRMNIKCLQCHQMYEFCYAFFAIFHPTSTSPKVNIKEARETSWMSCRCIWNEFSILMQCFSASFIPVVPVTASRMSFWCLFVNLELISCFTLVALLLTWKILVLCQYKLSYQFQLSLKDGSIVNQIKVQTIDWFLTDIKIWSPYLCAFLGGRCGEISLVGGSEEALRHKISQYQDTIFPSIIMKLKSTIVFSSIVL